MIIATHNAKFHTDDVFAVAALHLLLGKDKCEVVRTRDESVIAKADYVVDVGNIYDSDKNRFDHHQSGGAGERENGIPYASVGLVWKKFGEEISGSEDVARYIDRALIQSIDAGDNGKDISKMLIDDVFPFDLNQLVNLYRSTWKESGDWDVRFASCVDWATSVLKRAIDVSMDLEEGKNLIVDIYNKSEDKQIVVIDKKYDFGRELVVGTLVEFPEPVYAVLYRADVDNWQVAAVRKHKGAFELRKPLPKEWGAKSNKELEEKTGVPGSVYCHRAGFMCIVSNKEVAIKLARTALDA